ncbi:hypothetical protein Tco_0329041 [Tanacetum coccineum]
MKPNAPFGATKQSTQPIAAVPITNRGDENGDEGGVAAGWWRLWNEAAAAVYAWLPLSSNLFVDFPDPKRRNRRRSKQRVEPFSLEETSVVTMADQRTMAELLQAPTEGYGDAIVIPAILADNFELKHGLLNLVTSKQFYGFEKEDPHAHIRWFNKITSTIKYKDQRFDESFCEAWDRFKELLRACPHHGFMKLHQLDTFYNALTPTDKDSLNAAVGVSANTPSSSTPHFLKIAALADAVKAMLLQKSSPPASVKAVEEICITYGGPHPYHQCLATDGNVFSEYRDNIQGYVLAAAFFQMNTASSLGSGSLPSNIIANPRGDLKAITTQSGISYDGPPIPPPLSPLPKVVEREPEVTKATVQPSTENIQPPVVQTQAPIDEPVPWPMLVQASTLPLSLWKKLSLPEFTPTQMILELADRSTTSPSVDNEAITFKVGQTLRYSYNDVVSINRIDFIDVAYEEYAQEVLGFSDSSTSGNPTPSLDPILSTSSPSLNPFKEGDFISEEIKACLTNDSIPPGITDANFDPKGDLLLLEKLLNDDPSSPLPPK